MTSIGGTGPFPEVLMPTGGAIGGCTTEDITSESTMGADAAAVDVAPGDCICGAPSTATRVWSTGAVGRAKF